MMNKLLRLLGWSEPGAEGLTRSLRGLRTGDQRDMYVGLALVAVAYLRRTAPKKKLIYRKTVREGSALVVRHTRKGEPRLEVIKP
jgi:hypothetical protein